MPCRDDSGTRRNHVGLERILHGSDGRPAGTAERQLIRDGVDNRQDRIGQLGAVPHARIQPRTQFVAILAADMGRRQTMVIGIDGFALLGRVGQHIAAGAGLQQVLAFFHATVQPAVAYHDLAVERLRSGPGIARPRVRGAGALQLRLTNAAERVTVVFGVNDHFFTGAAGQAGAHQAFGCRSVSAGHVFELDAENLVVGRVAHGGDPGRHCRRRDGRFIGSGVACRRSNENAGRACRKECTVHRSRAPGVARVAADRVIDHVDAVRDGLVYGLQCSRTAAGSASR